MMVERRTALFELFRSLLPLALVGVAVSAAAQPSRAPEARGETIKIGILPFGDATASGNARVGTDVGRTMLSEIASSTSLVPKLLPATTEETTADTAVAIGRKQHVDVVFIGTVLDAKTEESSTSGWMPSIKGQSANVRLRRVSATVILQGELYDVVTGARLFSGRATGKESNNSIGGTAYTKFGSWGNDDYRAFLDSPMGKALQAAIADMTKKVAASRRGSS